MSKKGETKIEFLGDVTDYELVSLYQKSKAVIFAASEEDFGLVPVEAMAAGRPVIACAQGGVLESVVDGKTGVYFANPTVHDLGRAVNKFISLNKKGVFDAKSIRSHTQRFSRKRFKTEIKEFVEIKFNLDTLIL